MRYLIICEQQCCKLAEELKAGWPGIDIIEHIDMFSCKVDMPAEQEAEIIAALNAKGGYSISQVKN